MLRVRRFVGLRTLPESYSELFEEAGRQSIFLSFPWFRNFERTMIGRDEIVLVYGVENDAPNGHPLGALVLRHKRGNSGLLNPATVEAMANYYTAYFGPVMACDDRATTGISRAFASALWQDRHSWDVINLRALDPQSPTFACLVQSFREVGMAVQTYFCFGNWYLDVAGRSYAEYFKARPTVLRRNIPYQARKLDRTGRVRFEMVTGEEGLEKALDDYEKVYTASWRVPEPYPGFVGGLAQTAADNGWLRLGLLYLDDQPVAAQLWIVHGGIASIYKICYQERFASFSVGKILTSRLMQHVIDVDRVKEVDYLSGDDAYKKDWMSHRRERWGIMAFNPRSVNGCIQAALHVGGRFVKRTFMRLHRSRAFLPLV